MASTGPGLVISAKGSAQPEIPGPRSGPDSLLHLSNLSRTSEWRLEPFGTRFGRGGVTVSSFGRAITEVTTAIAGSSGGVPSQLMLDLMRQD